MAAPSPLRSVGLLLLAAGESRRMGRPKQLLPYAGTTFLRHACQTALATAVSPVIVVLGSDSEACAAEVADLPVACVLNPHWIEGMSASLRAGLACLIDRAPQCAGTVVLLPDQPLVTPQDVTALLAAWDPPERPIAASSYNGIVGVPAVFSRAFFSELTALRGQEGARAVIARHASQTVAVKIPAAARDLDTWEDYQKIVSG